MGKTVVIEWKGKLIRLIQSGKEDIRDEQLKRMRRKFKVLVEITNGTGIVKTTFDFYDSIASYDEGIENLDEKAKGWAFYSFVSDAINYLDHSNIDDFASEFRYTKVSEVIKSFKGCKRSYCILHNRFGLSDDDLYELSNFLQEKYD